MTVTLSRRALASSQASIEDCLRACGAQPWDRDALRQYQREQEEKALSAHFVEVRRALVSAVTLCEVLAIAAFAALVVFDALPIKAGAVLGLYFSAKLLCHLSRLPGWQTSDLLRGDLYWQDGIKRPLPPPAQQIVDGVRAFFPKADFAVSFIGRDPVLHVFAGGRSHNALVWEINADGTIEIIPPPSD